MDIVIGIVATVIYLAGGSFTHTLLNEDADDELGATVAAVLWPCFWALIASFAVICVPVMGGSWLAEKLKKAMK